MTATSHTPGPWKILPTGRDCYITNGEIDEGEEIDPFSGKTSRYKEERRFAKAFGLDAELNKANARLIAASPAMFDFITMHALNGDKKAQEIIASIDV